MRSSGNTDGGLPQQSVGQVGNNHDIKLQSLRLVNGHDRHRRSRDLRHVLLLDEADEVVGTQRGALVPHAPELHELEGLHIVVVANLQHARLRGEVSQGMLLAVRDEGGVRVLTSDGPVASGLRVS